MKWNDVVAFCKRRKYINNNIDLNTKEIVIKFNNDKCTITARKDKTFTLVSTDSKIAPINAKMMYSQMVSDLTLLLWAETHKELLGENKKRIRK